jgi:hypothetical protein
MYERMGFILKAPVRFDPRSINTSTSTVDPALFADIETYRKWWDEPLEPNDAATLLCGLKPHKREERDDDSWIDAFEWLCRRIERAVARDELAGYPTLGELVEWSRQNRVALPEALEKFTQERRRGARRSSTTSIEGIIIAAVDEIDLRAKKRSVPFDRRSMPGTKKELVDFIRPKLPRHLRREAATLQDYFKSLDLRWPIHAERGGLQTLLGQLDIATGSLGDVGLGTHHRS